MNTGRILVTMFLCIASYTPGAAHAQSPPTPATNPNVEQNALDAARRQNIPLTPVNHPVMGDPDLIFWTVSSVRAVFQLNFKDYRFQLDKASEHFTDRGWIAYITAFKSSGNVDKIKNLLLIGSAVPEKAPLINSQGVVGDLYTYKVEIPLIVTYKNKDLTNAQHLIVSVVVIRTIAPDHPDGIAIDQITAVPA